MKTLFTAFLKYFHLLLLLNTGVDIYRKWEEIKTELVSMQESLVNLDERIKLQARKNKDIVEFKKNLEKSQERIKDVTLQIERVQKQLPNTIIDTEILDFFSKEAQEMNIKDVFLAPIKEENKDFYYGKTYQFKGAATFLQFLIFFEQVGESDRLFNVKSLSMVRKNDKQKGRFQLLDLNAVMEAFRFNPDYKQEDMLKK